jgi:L-iditol 2-dehydrogenase
VTETMQAAYFVEKGRVEIRDVPKPIPGPGEVLVEMKAVGICGSDMTIFRYGGIGSNVARNPLVMGHEGAGMIAALGPGVTGWNVGDAVVLEPGIPCRRCEFCKEGNYHLCLSVIFRGVPPSDGIMAQYVTTPADFAFQMPSNLDFVHGTLIEPLAVGLMAAQVADVQVGHSVAIFGCGPIGLTNLLAARSRGATRVFVVDVVPSRLEVAVKLGAEEVIDARSTDPVARIMELTNGRGVDRTLETAGSPATTNMAINAVKRGGTVGLVGIVHQPEVPVDIVRIVRSGLRVHGVFRYANIYPSAVALAQAGTVDLSHFVTHTFPLSDLQRAMEFVETHKDQVIKGVMTI